MKHRVLNDSSPRWRPTIAAILCLLAMLGSGQAPGTDAPLAWLSGRAERGFFVEKLLVAAKEGEKARVFVECRSYSGGCFEDDDSRRAWPGGEELSAEAFEALWAQAGGRAVRTDELPPWLAAVADWESAELARAPGAAFGPWLVAPEGGVAEATLFYCDGPLRIIVAIEGRDGLKAFRAQAPCLPLVRLAPEAAAPAGGLEARSSRAANEEKAQAQLGSVLRALYESLKEASPDKALALEDCARRASGKLLALMTGYSGKDMSPAEKAAIALALGSMAGRLYQGISSAEGALRGVKARELAAGLPEEAVLARLLLAFLLSDGLAMPYFARENARLAASGAEALPYDYRQYRPLSRDEGQRVAEAALLAVVGGPAKGLSGPGAAELGNLAIQILRPLGPEAFAARPEGALVVAAPGADASRYLIELGPRGQGTGVRVAHVEAWAAPNLAWEEGSAASTYRFRADGSLEGRAAAPGLNDGRVDRAADSGAGRGGPGLRFASARSIGAIALMMGPGARAAEGTISVMARKRGEAGFKALADAAAAPSSEFRAGLSGYERVTSGLAKMGKGIARALAPSERLATSWLFLGSLAEGIEEIAVCLPGGVACSEILAFETNRPLANIAPAFAPSFVDDVAAPGSGAAIGCAALKGRPGAMAQVAGSGKALLGSSWAGMTLAPGEGASIRLNYVSRKAWAQLALWIEDSTGAPCPEAYEARLSIDNQAASAAAPWGLGPPRLDPGGIAELAREGMVLSPWTKEGRPAPGAPLPYAPGGVDDWRSMARKALPGAPAYASGRAALGGPAYGAPSEANPWRFEGCDSTGLLLGALAGADLVPGGGERLAERFISAANGKPALALGRYQMGMASLVPALFSQGAPKAQASPSEAAAMSAAWRDMRIGIADLMRASIAVPAPSMARPGDILVGAPSSGGHEPHVGVVVGLVEPGPDGLLPAGLRDAEARRRIRVVSMAREWGQARLCVWGDDYGPGGELRASGGFALGAREAGRPLPEEGYQLRRIMVARRPFEAFSAMAARPEAWDFAGLAYEGGSLAMALELPVDAYQAARSPEGASPPRDRWIPNTGEGLAFGAVFRDASGAAPRRDIEAALLPPLDRFWAEGAADEQANNVRRNRGAGFEILCFLPSGAGLRMVRVARFALNPAATGPEEAYQANSAAPPGAFWLRDGSLRYEEDGAFAARFFIRPLDGSIYPGDDIRIRVGLALEPGQALKPFLAPAEDYMAVYDKKLLWRANLYIDEGANDWNELNPWNAHPTIDDGVKIPFKLAGKEYPNGIDGYCFYGRNEWNRGYAFTPEFSESALPASEFPGRQGIVPKPYTWRDGIDYNKKSVAYSINCHDSPFEFNNKMDHQKAVLNYKFFLNVAPYSASGGNNLTSWTEYYAPKNQYLNPATFASPAPSQWATPAAPNRWYNYAHSSSIAVNSFTGPSPLANGTYYPYMPGFASEWYRVAPASVVWNTAMNKAAGVDCTGIVQRSGSYEGAKYTYQKLAAYDWNEPDPGKNRVSFTINTNLWEIESQNVLMEYL